PRRSMMTSMTIERQGPRLAQLDGLRAEAILGVMLHHFGVKPCGWWDWGPVAPTMFFLLSGFLITGTLEKVRAGGGADAGWLIGFHLRWFARLAPALYLLLAMGWLAGLREYREGWLWHGLFLSNVKMAAAGEWAASLSHLWSLAMQEQFYLMWPLILLVPRAWLAATLIGLCAAAAGFRATCLAFGAPEMFRWLMLPGSLDAFAMGGLLAIACRKVEMRGAVLWGGGLLAAGCYVASRILRHLDGTGSPWMALVETFEVLAFGWLILMLVRRPESILARLLASRPLAFLGTLSYGLFIWHMLVASALAPWLDAWGLSIQAALLPRTLILLSASLLFAWLSWAAIERPSIGWAREAADRLAASLGQAWRTASQRLAMSLRGFSGEEA
ncbi:MAG: acyltransferase, partial [Terrimicrobiaceae bacterium]|nr:acyltransferase [Terrimicrobiaceae bacterium]